MKEKKNNKKPEITNSFKVLFIQFLKGVYDTETAQLQFLYELQKESTTEGLQEVLENYRLLTQKHIYRLEKVLGELNIEHKAEECNIVGVFSKIVDKVIKSSEGHSMARDAGFIVVTQQISHYMIATYGGLIQFSLALGERKIAFLLECSLEEEENIDMALTEVAECCVSTDSEDGCYWDECDIEVVIEEEIKSNRSLELSKEKENVVKKKSSNSSKK